MSQWQVDGYWFCEFQEKGAGNHFRSTLLQDSLPQTHRHRGFPNSTRPGPPMEEPIFRRLELLGLLAERVNL